MDADDATRCVLVALAALVAGVAAPRCARAGAPRARRRAARGSCSRSSAPRCREPALEAALRLARAEDATLVPVYLATVPLPLPLDAPLAARASGAHAVRGDRESAPRGGRPGRRAHRARPHVATRCAS